MRLARQAVNEVGSFDAELGAGAPELDPASTLFFEFAAPLLLSARNEQEFRTASDLADFVWAATEFDARTQVILLNDFIDGAGVPAEMLPWLLDVYAELAERKLALIGG